MPIAIVGTSPIVEIKVNGKPVPVHFDLGNSDSVSLFPAFLDEIEKQRVGETGGRKSLYGSEDGKPVYRVETVQVGEFAVS
ncbi:MAG: retropepsin-like domain-containing protein, partial [Gammaproteobacteria bacterium]|nr:retropepsin-like domain-containing protein [Gammaproteobacteria bacterium]